MHHFCLSMGIKLKAAPLLFLSRSVELTVAHKRNGGPSGRKKNKNGALARDHSSKQTLTVRHRTTDLHRLIRTFWLPAGEPFTASAECLPLLRMLRDEGRAVVRLHTTVGQTSEHDSALWPQDSADELVLIDSSNKDDDNFNKNRSVASQHPGSSPGPSSWTAGRSSEILPPQSD